MKQTWKLVRRVIRQRREARRAGKPVVWWMLTPAARMGNLGDQAQAVAVAGWLRDSLGIEPIELDKDEYAWIARWLRLIIRPGELILLQSGGNLGERGVLTERARRRIIGEFGKNPIISLPQTISFSDTANGRAEAEASRVAYAQHQSLEVIARDAISLERGASLFPHACRVMAPDPVLLMAKARQERQRSGVLLVLRSDKERRIEDGQQRAIESSLADRTVTHFDTKVDYPVRRGRRADIIGEVFDEFARHELVVTDRFHGMVFAFATDTPCIVLENIDHKIRSGIEWLEGCPSIRLAGPDEPLRPVIQAVLSAPRPSDCAQAQERVESAYRELADLVRLRLNE